jgi:putative membrane protein
MMNYKLVLAAAGMPGLTVAPSMAALSSTDRTFVPRTAAGGLAEVSLGQLARRNAGPRQVRDFGQLMVMAEANRTRQ